LVVVEEGSSPTVDRHWLGRKREEEKEQEQEQEGNRHRPENK
jgi:hypothetical protein